MYHALEKFQVEAWPVVISNGVTYSPYPSLRVTEWCINMQASAPDRRGAAEFPGPGSPGSPAVPHGSNGAEMPSLRHRTRVQDGPDVHV